METRKTSDGEKADIGRLLMEAVVVLASSKLSADEVEQRRHSGTLTMNAPAGQPAYLEAGGVVVAEGVVRKQHGKSAFVVTRTYQEASGVRS